MLLIIGCFTKTQHKNRLSNDRNIFEPVGNVYFDDLLAQAAEEKKPLLLFFTAYSARSTSRMEDYIRQNKAIIKRLKSDFIFVPLHLDNKEKLSKNELVTNEITQRTVGQKYYKWQVEKFKTNAQPYFVIIDAKGNKVKDMIYTKDFSKINDFFLKK